ncbi:MAG: DUF481 domain-containing protein [Saprospiraceae bacterium]
MAVKRCKLLICLVIVMSSIHHLSGQIINIEQKRIITDTVGFAGNIGLSVNASRYSQSFFAFNSNGHIQFKSHRHLILAFINYALVNVSGSEFNRNGFSHLRYNYEVNDLLRLEAFTQLQLNALLNIKNRNLNGLGIRLKLSQYENAKFYFGLAYMYEREALEQEKNLNIDNRMSSYFTFTLTPQENVKLSNTSYVQPLFNNFSDFRFSNDLVLSFQITKNLSFVTNFHFLYDAKPPVGIPTNNYEVTNGLSFAF